MSQPTPTPAPILVDDRVGSIEIAKHLKIPVEVTRLEYGDFAFFGNGPDDAIISVGIERKTLGDLVNSMQSGRLSGHQLIGLVETYNIIYLLVEGEYRVNLNTGAIMTGHGKNWTPLGYGARTFMYREVANFLNTLAIIGDIHVWFTHNPEESGAWVRFTYNWWQKEWEDHKAHKAFNRSKLAPSKALLVKPPVSKKLFNMLTDIGWEKAEALLQRFPTMESLVMAEPKDIQEVKGVGKGLANSIWRELHVPS
uniref:Putative nuclease n=1 Tax=viral metagenome TaxID=1070528 RepID=A0A6M3K7S3_9ZZZZ